jgi:hypothetical protein
LIFLEQDDSPALDGVSESDMLVESREMENNKRLTQKIKTNRMELLWGNERVVDDDKRFAGEKVKAAKAQDSASGLMAIDKNHEISFNLKIK